MRKRCVLAQIIPFALSALAVNTVCAQNFPNRPIRVVTAEPGSGPDLVARMLARALPNTLGQQIIVENQAGANGILAAGNVAKAVPDGHTLLIYSAALWTFPLLQKAPYDPVRDFAPIAIAASSPSLIVVHPSLPVNSVRELISLAKAKPGQLAYASGGIGAANHLAAELFKSMAGVDILRVGYKGGADAQADLVAGRVQLTFASGAIVMPLIKARRLKALAVTSAQPSPLFPGLATADATGLKGYESVSRFNVFAPAKTPDAIVSRLNQEIVRALNLADVKSRLFETGIEVVASSPEQLVSVITSDTARLSKVIQNFKITSD